MNISSTLKKILVAATVTMVVVVGFLTHALGGLRARPVTFAEPPAFVEQYAAAMKNSALLLSEKGNITGGAHINKSGSEELAADFTDEKSLVHKVIFNGDSRDLLLQLFAHPEKAQRVKIAFALAAINVEFTHDEESGFAEKREQFWVDVEAHLPDIQNALSEALIASAEEGASTRIPYTLAWMPGQNHETVELLAWAAQHHPDWWVRRFSVYFVVRFGENEELARSVLRSRTHDPDYKVRKQVLDLRIKRFIGEK